MSRHMALLISLALVLWGGTAAWHYQVLAVQGPGMVWDFYPLWQAGRWLLEGRDPYSDALTLEVQLRSYGRPAQGEEDPHTFAYPMPTLCALLPLFLLPLPLAQAIWLSTLLWGLVWAMVGLTDVLAWPRVPIARAGLLVWSLLLYPVAWGLLLGQPAVLMFALLVAALIALQWQRDGWAGVALALATLKPQLTVLAAVGLLLWSAWQHRWRMWAGFGGALAVLLGASFGLYPGWVGGFLYALGRYTALMPFLPPVALLARLFPEGETGVMITLAVSLLAIWVWYWVREARRSAVPMAAVGLSLVVTTLVALRISQANHVVLLVPLMTALASWAAEGCGWARAVVAVVAVLLVGPWLLDALLMPPLGSPAHYRHQHMIFASLFPMITLVLLTTRPQGWGHGHTLCCYRIDDRSAPPDVRARTLGMGLDEE
jgi:hypothetical protein